MFTSKIYSLAFFAIIMFSSLACGESGSLSIDIKPAEYANLEDSAKKDLLNRIASESLQIIIRDSQSIVEFDDNFAQVIKARKWLEQTNDSTARLLAMMLQYSVDSCILNKLVNLELLGDNESKVSTNSEMKAIEKLLDENLVDVDEYLNFIVNSNETLKSKLDKNNISINNFKSKQLYDKVPSTIIENEYELNNQEKEIIPKDQNVFPAFFGFINQNISKQEMQSAYLHICISMIDCMREARLLFETVNDDNLSEKKIFKSKDVRDNVQLIDSLISKFDKKQTDLLIRNNTKDARGFACNSISRIQNRVNSPRGKYLLHSISFQLRYFIKDLEVFPVEIRKAIEMNGYGICLKWK